MDVQPPEPRRWFLAAVDRVTGLAMELECLDCVAVASRLRWLAEVFERLADADEFERTSLSLGINRTLADIEQLTGRRELEALRDPTWS